MRNIYLFFAFFLNLNVLCQEYNRQWGTVENPYSHIRNVSISKNNDMYYHTDMDYDGLIYKIDVVTGNKNVFFFHLVNQHLLMKLNLIIIIISLL